MNTKKTDPLYEKSFSDKMYQNKSVCLISLHGWTGNNNSLSLLKYILPNKNIIWEFLLKKLIMNLNLFDIKC